MRCLPLLACRCPNNPPAYAGRLAGAGQLLVPRQRCCWPSARALRFISAGLGQRQQALADARKQIDTIDGKLVALAREPQRQQVEQDAKVQARFQHTKVIGPATTQRGAANAYRLTTQTPLGHPAAAQVAVNVLNKSPGQETEQVQFNQTYQTAGELQFVVPPIPALPGSQQRLVIETSNGIAKEVINQQLTTVEPTYVTHIALSNSTLMPGETVFFRTATLDRFALTPVDRPLNLSFTLNRVADNKLEPVKKLHCTTGPGGVAGGAEVLRTIQRAPDFGVDAGVPVLDLNRSQARKQEVIDRLTKGLESLLKGRKVTVYNSRGEVADAAEHRCGSPTAPRSRARTW